MNKPQAQKPTPVVDPFHRPAHGDAPRYTSFQRLQDTAKTAHQQLHPVTPRPAFDKADAGRVLPDRNQ